MMSKYALPVVMLLASCSNTSPSPSADAAGLGDTVSSGGQGGGLGSGGRLGSGGAAGATANPATGGSGGAGTSAADAAVAGGGVGGMGGGSNGSGGAAMGGAGGSMDSGGPSSRQDAEAPGREAGFADGSRDVLATDASAPADTASPADLSRPDLAATGNVTAYVAGDSTVSTYTNSSIHQGGWGQFLQDYFDAKAKVVNKAVGGMTARHFIEAGYLDAIISTIKAGDYLLVQFGTNDGNKTATYTLPGSSTEIPYYLDPSTDFKTYLTKYVDATRAKGATTIFVTPPPRHSCNAGEMGVKNGLASYATAMKELGPTLKTPVVDLNAMVITYLANVSCETSGSTFYLVKADGSIDSTHFQEKGANVMAGLVAKGSAGIATLDVSLAGYVK
jgi:lysophospholipase L1-like esterase